MRIEILLVENDWQEREDILASIQVMCSEILAPDQFHIDPDPYITLPPQAIEAWIEAHPGPILLVLDVFQDKQQEDLDEFIPDIIEKYLQPDQPSPHKIALIVYTGNGDMQREERSQAVPPLHYLFKFHRKRNVDKYQQLRRYLQQSIPYLQE